MNTQQDPSQEHTRDTVTERCRGWAPLCGERWGQSRRPGMVTIELGLEEGWGIDGITRE